MWPFRSRKIEKRASYTALALEALTHRAAGLGSAQVEAVGILHACALLWQSGLSRAAASRPVSVENLALAGRALALEGNAVFYLDDAGGWWPAVDYDLATRNGRPYAYRMALADTAGPRNHTALAGEVLHFRVGASLREPWHGVAPYRRATLTAGTLAAVESVACELYENAPMGSQVIATPEDPAGQNATLARSFRGKRGRVLLRESAQVLAAGGPTPAGDWRPNDLTPNVERAQIPALHGLARASLMSVYGVMPAMMADDATAQAIREADRHLAQWILQPVAETMAAEISEKTGREITLDVVAGTRSYDVGGRARAAGAVIDAMIRAKEAGISDAQVAAALDSAGVPM